jgi:hypothetical protein
MIRIETPRGQAYIAAARDAINMRMPRRQASMAASAPDLRQWRWEYAGGATIKVYGGEIQIGEQAAVAVADTTVTITANLQYVGWRYVKATKALTIVNFGTAVPYTAGTIEKWLYLFALVSGTEVFLAADGTLNPVFPANFGDT